MFKKQQIILITTVVLNRLDMFIESFGFFLAKTDVRDGVKVFHVVVNNGSNEETTKWLRKHNSYFDILIELNSNCGVAKAVNLGWGQFYNTHKLKFDPDIVIHEGSENWLIQSLELLNQGVDIFGIPTSRICPQVVQQVDNKRLIVPQNGEVVNGACFFVSNNMFKKLGYFSEDYGLYGYEDMDYNARVRLIKSLPLYLDGLNLEHIDLHSAMVYGYDKRELKKVNSRKYESNMDLYMQNLDNLFIHKSLFLSNPLVVIVMPVYNQAKYVREAVYSILKQSYKNFKLIIVNDGSTDDLKSIIEQYYKDNRIVYLEKSNGGTGSALNLGFDYARKNIDNIKYGTWVSGDNIYDSEFLLNLITFMEENEQYGLVYAPFMERIEETGKLIIPNQHKQWDKQDMKKGCQMGICFLFNWFLKLTVGEYIKDVCEDFDMHIRMAAYSDFYFLNKKILGVWRNHKEAMSNKVHNNKLSEANNECLRLAKEIL